MQKKFQVDPIPCFFAIARFFVSDYSIAAQRAFRKKFIVVSSKSISSQNTIKR